jgi:hypothetical protein
MTQMIKLEEMRQSSAVMAALRRGTRKPRGDAFGSSSLSDPPA